MLAGSRIFARVSVAALVGVSLATASCGGGEVTGPPAAVVTSVLLTPRDTTLVAGTTATFSARPVDADGNVVAGQSITWSTSDPAVATVSGGVVTALRAGTARLGAKNGSVEATATITVVPSIAEVRVTPSPDTVIIGQTRQLTAALLDASGAALSGRKVTWSSSDVAKATVSDAGVVTGVALGTLTITAASEGRTGSATVVVRPVPVASVTVTPSPDTVIVGKTRQLTAALTDASGATLTGREVTWSSSDVSKATVGATGVVTGVAAGTVTIFASSDGRTGTATVVVRPVPVAGVTITPSPVSVGSGSTVALTATLRDAEGNVLTGRPIVWSVGNGAIATVTQAGVVTGVSAGSTTVTASSEGATDTETVTVTDATVPFVSELAVTPATLHISSNPLEVTITMKLVDRGGSGVASVTVTGAPSGGTGATCSATSPSAGTRADGTWTCRLTIPDSTPSNTWGLTVVTVDAAGNRTEMGRTALEQAGLPGSFVVNFDPDLPLISSFDISPDTVDVGTGEQKVTVTVSAADAGSGVVHFEATATAPDRSTTITCNSAAPVSGTAANGRWSCQLVFPPTSERGAWGVSIFVADAAFNVTFVGGGAITVTRQ